MQLLPVDLSSELDSSGRGSRQFQRVTSSEQAGHDLSGAVDLEGRGCHLRCGAAIELFSRPRKRRDVLRIFL